VRIDDLDAGPFTAAGLSPALVAAYDELIGPGRWTSPVGVGRALMVRFPSQDRAGAGYHIEASAVSAPAGFTLDGTDPSPVAEAIVSGLAMTD
jgi:hypothetical protein